MRTDWRDVLVAAHLDDDNWPARRACGTSGPDHAVHPAQRLRKDDLVTNDQRPKRHRRPGNPVGVVRGPGHGVVVYICALVGSGWAAINYAATHDEAWWWLKVLAAVAAFVLLAAAGIWLARSMLSVTWRHPNRLETFKERHSAPDPSPRSETSE